MLCKRVPLSSQRDGPEADGDRLHRGNPLTYFYLALFFAVFAAIWVC